MVVTMVNSHNFKKKRRCFTMDMNKYKRDYKYRSTEGAESGKWLKWLIILLGIAVALLAYFLK